MPKPVKKKKKFISKKESTTYRLIPGFVKDENDTTPQETVDEIEVRKEEQRKYGVFFDDSYNYMKHLKCVSEQATLVESFHKDTYSETQSDSGRPPVPTEHFSTDVTEDDDIDADVLAALENAPVVRVTEDEKFDEDMVGTDNILDDDFIATAGGPVSVTYTGLEDSSEDEFLEDEEDEEGTDDGDEHDTDGMDFADVQGKSLSHNSMYGRGNVQDDITEAQTALILKNFEEGLGFRCSVQFSDEEVDKPTAEDYENLKQILKDDGITEKPATWSEIFDDRSEIPKIDVSRYLYEDDEDEYEWKEVGATKPKFDCMSILSLNSNTRNLPTDIIPPRSEVTKSQTGEGKQGSGLHLNQLQEEIRNSHRADKACTYRPKDETADEKRARKKAIKDERKERRIEKKANKELFAAEREKMKKETAALSKSVRSIQIY